MNIYIAAAIGLFAFTIAAGFIPTTELGTGLGISIGLAFYGLAGVPR